MQSKRNNNRPTVSIHLREICVKSGKTLQILCNFNENCGINSVKWYFNDQPIDNMYFWDYRRTKNFFILYDVDENANGKFTCEVTNKLGLSSSDSAEVSVF